MVYAQVVNGQVVKYPLNIDRLVTENVLSSLTPTPEELAAVNLVEVRNHNPQRPIDPHNYIFGPKQQPDGVWVEDWILVDTSVEAIQANTDIQIQKVRRERDVRLGYSDWTQLPDVPIETRQQWAAYRQALRDVPTQTGFPWEVVWPQRP